MLYNIEHNGTGIETWASKQTTGSQPRIRSGKLQKLRQYLWISWSFNCIIKGLMAFQDETVHAPPAVVNLSTRDVLPHSPSPFQLHSFSFCGLGKLARPLSRILKPKPNNWMYQLVANNFHSLSPFTIKI